MEGSLAFPGRCQITPGVITHEVVRPTLGVAILRANPADWGGTQDVGTAIASEGVEEAASLKVIERSNL
jgi:hypothetical protein